MLAKTIVASTLAALSFSAAALDYFVVVPVKGRTATTAQPVISVTLYTYSVPGAQEGVSYTFNLKPLLSVTGDGAYTGAGVTWSVVSSTLPAGLALTADGFISGTPTASGTGAITVRATYKDKNGEQTYTVNSAGVGIVLTGATRTWANGTVAASCQAYRNPASGYSYSGDTGDGTYRIQPAGQSAMDVYCDMTQDGGGWILIGKFNGSTDTTMAAAQRSVIPYTQAKLSLNGTATQKVIACHTTAKAGFAVNNTSGVNCTKADADGSTYSIRVLQAGVHTGGNYGFYQGASLNVSGGCYWTANTTKVWGRHYNGAGSTFCTNYGNGENYSSPNGWGTNMAWLYVR